MTLFRQARKNRLIVHLVNFQPVVGRTAARGDGYESTPNPVFDEVIPVHDLTVRVLLPPAHRRRTSTLPPMASVPGRCAKGTGW